MKNKLKDKLDLEDELDNIHAMVCFLSEAACRIAENDYPLGEQVIVGISLVYDYVEERIKAVSAVLETAKLTLEEV